MVATARIAAAENIHTHQVAPMCSLSNAVFFAPPYSLPSLEQYLDRFIRFCRVDCGGQQADADQQAIERHDNA